MPRTLLKILLLLLTLYLALVWARVFPHPAWLPDEIEPLTVISGILLALVQWWEGVREKARDLAPHPAPKYLATPPSELTSGVIPRPDELRDLRRQLRHSSRPVVICGIGGLGKTTFAQLYCQRFGGSYRQVVWLSASAVFSGANIREADNAEYFLRAFIEDRTLLSKLNIVFDDRDTAKQRFDKVIARLADEEGPMLLVIDNAPEAAARFTTELSRLKNWRVLLTSRDEIHNMDAYHLDTLPPQRAAQLFCNIYGDRSTDPAIDTVIRAYGYHTLTIELLAAYAREKNIQPFELQHELEARGLLQLDALHLGLPNAPKMQSLSEHLLQTFLLELDEQEQEIMRCMCLLPPSNTLLEPGLMSEDFLCELFGKKADKVAFQNTLRSLARLHWLVKEAGEFRCHPVVAETAKAQLLPDAENCAVLIENVTELLIPDEATNEPTINRAHFAPLGEAVFAGLWKEKGDFVEADGLVARLALRLGWLYEDLGEFIKALDFGKKMVAIWEKVLPEDHVSLAAAYNNLAITFGNMGANQKQLEYNEKALAIGEKVLSPEHPDLAQFYNNLAEAFRALGDYNKSLEYNEKALAIREKVLPPEHPDLAQSYNNLALTYGELGEHQKSLRYHEKALAICEKVLPPEHPDLATSYNNLAETFRALKEHKKSLEYHEKALVIREKVLLPEHPDLAQSYNNLAITYHDLGDINQAVNFLRKAVAIWGKALPDTHPYVAGSKSDLAFLEEKLRSGKD